MIAPQNDVRGTRTAALSAPCKNRNAALLLLPLTSQVLHDTMAIMTTDDFWYVVPGTLCS